MFCGGPYGTADHDNQMNTYSAESIYKNSTTLFKKYNSLGLIDDPKNVKNMPVFIFSGTDLDEVVWPMF